MRKTAVFIIVSCFAICSAANGQTRIITTVAGSSSVFPINVTAALDAPLGLMAAVAVDAQGNFYAADPSNNIVVEVSPAGVLHIVAGNGVSGFSGDGGPGASASLGLNTGGAPSGGVALDSAGNLFISDISNQRIRKVSPGGIITTVAGNGNQGFSGDGGPALNASLANPTAIATDASGNLYIVDSSNARVRKVSPGGVITTVAGNGTNAFAGDGGSALSASLNYPSGVAVDQSGNIFIAELLYRIRKVSAANGVIATVAGTGANGSSGDGGPATSAMLNQPFGLAFDGSGNLYIADSGNNRIREVAVNGVITTVAGAGGGGGASNFGGDGGPATSAALLEPSGVALDAAGNLFIADSGADVGNERIRKVTTDGIINTVAGNGLFRFSGDGGPATSAQLHYPTSAISDASGNLYIADSFNSRVRMVAPNGVITTVAGTGTYGFSGDGGPATAAEFREPQSVAIDASGNLFIADVLTNRIREVSPSTGFVTTVVGNGSYGLAGDGGPATAASLNYPYCVVVDSSGNLFIADMQNNAVRKVSASGVITTVAGKGGAGFSGDGGPATAALLNSPSAVAVDAQGNLFIADSFNYRIRKVSSSSGLISTVAGNGSSAVTGNGGLATAAGIGIPEGIVVDPSGNLFITFVNGVRMVSASTGTITAITALGNSALGDGGPAISAHLFDPTGLGLDSSGDLFVSDSGNGRIREILAQAPTLQLSASSVTFTASSGGKPVSAGFTVSTSTAGANPIHVPGLAYQAQISTSASWLSISPQSGSTPGLITATANPLGLAPAVYNAVITIGVPMANPAMQTVNVQFTVTAGAPASISVDQSHMSFTYATTSAARSQTLIVSNSGGGSLNFTTSIKLFTGASANWLSVTPQSGTATPANPVSLAVRADPSVLPPGTYTGSVTVQASGNAGSVTVPVTMTITTNPLVLLLSQSGFTFTAVQNGGAVPPQTFGVLDLGSGSLNWSVQTSTLSGGNWLMASPGSGSSSAAVSAPLVTVSVNPAGLQPGVYYGLVQVVSAGAANTPQEVVAVLQVLPAGTDVAPIVQPSSLIFSSPAGVSSPSSQNVLAYDPTGTSKSFRSGIALMNGSGWLVTLPTDATIAPTGPTNIVVQPVVNGLAPGTYLGTLTLEFSDGRVSTVGITFVVTGAGGSASPGSSLTPHATSSCTPTKLIPVLTTLGPGFTVPASYPQGLTAQVADDCGNPLTQGQVSVQFSTGQGLKYMQSLNNGRWDVTWQTGSQQASQVIVTVHATNSTQTIAGDAQINGALGAPQAAPAVSDGGVVSAATFVATPLSPGGIISVFGSQLSDATGSAPVLPLSTQLNNTTVFLGNLQLPLFFTSAGQVNAAVPYEANVNTNLQLLVQRDNTYATPVYVDVAATQPGVLQYGQMQAIAVDVKGNLISPMNPAHAGDILVMYCLGLGAVTPAVADGAAAPSNPPASTVNPVTVTVGNQMANVLFAGLTPTLAGLYQIDLYVPQGAGTGDQVPVTLSTGGQTSTPVNLSVR